MRKRPTPADIEPIERSTGQRSYRRVGRTEDVERVVVWLDETLAEALDAFVARCGYDSRSDALRDLIRTRVYAADGRSPGRGGTRTAQERRGQARDQPARSTSATDDEGPAGRSEPVPMTTEQLLVAKYGPTMTYAELAAVLKRREGGLRQTLYVGRAPWCQRLIAARRKVGRRSFFRTPLVAAFLEEFADADLDPDS